MTKDIHIDCPASTFLDGTRESAGNAGKIAFQKLPAGHKPLNHERLCPVREVSGTQVAMF